MSAGTARRYVRDILVSRRVASSVVEAAELLTSEMVTYALRVSTAATTQELCIVVNDDRIHVEVCAAGLGPRSRGTAVAGPRGRRRALLDSLAAGWGADAGKDSRRLWFTVPRS